MNLPLEFLAKNFKTSSIIMTYTKNTILEVPWEETGFKIFEMHSPRQYLLPTKKKTIKDANGFTLTKTQKGNLSLFYFT